MSSLLPASAHSHLEVGVGEAPRVRGSPGGVGSWQQHPVISPDHTRRKYGPYSEGTEYCSPLVARADVGLGLNGDSFLSLVYVCACMQDLRYLSRKILSYQWNSPTLAVLPFSVCCEESSRPTRFTCTTLISFIRKKKFNPCLDGRFSKSQDCPEVGCLALLFH